MAAVDYFLKLDSIDGESLDRDRKDWIEVLSFSWGASNSGTGSVGGGAGAGKVSLQDFHFTANFSKASPALFLSCATGKHLKDATLIGRNAQTGNVEFIKIRLSDVLISSYQTGGSGDGGLPTDQFSLNFAKIEYGGETFDVTDGGIG